MLKITNNKESFIIENERLKKFENYYKYVNQNKNICVELLFLYEETNKSDKTVSIQKRLQCVGESLGDILKEYKILENDGNKIVLSCDDYIEIKRLVENLNKKDEYREDVYVESYSQIMAYECYLNYLVEELNSVSINDIFQYVCSGCLSSKEKEKYRKSIIQNTEKILKEKYDVDLGKIFMEVKESE